MNKASYCILQPTLIIVLTRSSFRNSFRVSRQTYDACIIYFRETRLLLQRRKQLDIQKR